MLEGAGHKYADSHRGTNVLRHVAHFEQRPLVNYRPQPSSGFQCPLRSMDRRELYVPRTRTTRAMSRSFAVIAPSLWNRLPPSARSSLLSSNLSTSLSLLKTCLFSWS